MCPIHCVRPRFALALFALMLLVTSAFAANDATSTWVEVAADKRLIYRTDEQGNTIPDFSRAGYGGGGVRLPELPVRVTLTPKADGDDGKRIQAAIDDVSARPANAKGFRGAVLLKAGNYRVGGTLTLHTGGVVLRGEGIGERGTTVIATGKTKRTFISIGDERATRTETPGTRRGITDNYVPWSAQSFHIESAQGLKPGDRIVVHRPSTAEWIREIGMDRIKNRPGAKPGETKMWKAGDYDLGFERTIMAIEGNRLTLDAPVMNALDKRFGGGAIYRYSLPRIMECGVERMNLVSEYAKGKESSDEEHAWTGIEFFAVENGWVREVELRHFSHALQASGTSLFVTFQDCAHLDPVSQITGSRRYSFGLNGQYGLALRCHSRGARHTFVTGSRVRGPNVFLEGAAVQSHSDSGPHHRWTVGSLYDNISDDNQLRAQDRQWLGSGHGWAGTQQVFWNCRSKSIVIQQPPTGQNYAIGCIGKFLPGDVSPQAKQGVIESAGQPVLPRSLYLAQLEARLGREAVENIAAKR